MSKLAFDCSLALYKESPSSPYSSVDIKNWDGVAQGASGDVIHFHVLSIHEQPIGSTVQKGLKTVFTTGGCFNVDVEVEGVRAPDR